MPLQVFRKASLTWLNKCISEAVMWSKLTRQRLVLDGSMIMAWLARLGPRYLMEQYSLYCSRMLSSRCLLRCSCTSATSLPSTKVSILRGNFKRIIRVNALLIGTNEWLLPLEVLEIIPLDPHRCVMNRNEVLIPISVSLWCKAVNQSSLTTAQTNLAQPHESPVHTLLLVAAECQW